MDKPMIGIRQADGSFYEILGDAQTGHKRLVLSAARADQHGVRIELYRSTDGTVDPSGALGQIVLDAQGLGYQDIEFRIDLDAAGQLEASATLPGQPPQRLSVDLTPFRETSPLPAVDAGLPPLDLGDSDAEPMTLDLPDFELSDEEAPPRTDSEILADEAFAEADLDSLDDFGLEEPQSPDTKLETLDDFSFEDPEGGTPETRGLDEFDLDSPDLDAPVDLDDTPNLEVPSLDDRMDLGAAPSFDLGDLDAGFGEAPTPGAENPAEDWEKISLDDMESMEFLDTGAEISTPSSKAPSQASRGDDSFRMDDDEPLELGDFESDLSDLPDFGDPQPQGKAGSSDLDTDFDQDFLPPPSLTEPSPWDTDPEPESVTASATPAAAVSKPSKPSKAARVERSAPAKTDGLDRMSLILSLAALSLLVLLILVLLFLNMIKAPQAPVIQPEVQRWKESTTLVASPRAPGVETIDLGGEAPTFVAETVMEIPAALKTARVTLALEAGETASDAARRFGPPARVQGDLLSW